MIEWMAQAASLREAGKKMNDRSLLLSLNEIRDYFKKWTTGRTLRLKVLRKSSSLEKKTILKSHLQVQLFITALLKYLL